MGFEAPAAKQLEVHVLTTHYQFHGGLEVVGDLVNFCNDPRRDSFTLRDVQMGPVMASSPLGTAKRTTAVIRRDWIVFLYFVSAEARASIRKLIKHELLVAYTPVAVCRGDFHMSAEAKLQDFMDSTQGSLLAVSDVRVFPLVDLQSPFPGEIDLLMVGHSQVLSYHPG